MENQIKKIIKETEKEIKKEIIEKAYNGFKVAVYYNCDDEKIHVDTIDHGTYMADNEIVLNYINGDWIDEDDFDEEEFMLFFGIIDELTFINELERKGGE